jgi:hypothetical protein
MQHLVCQTRIHILEKFPIPRAYGNAKFIPKLLAFLPPASKPGRQLPGIDAFFSRHRRIFAHSRCPIITPNLPPSPAASAWRSSVSLCAVFDILHIGSHFRLLAILWGNWPWIGPGLERPLTSPFQSGLHHSCSSKTLRSFHRYMLQERSKTPLIDAIL